MADDDLIQMQHPDIPGADPPTTTVRAFRTVWEPRGWERVPESVAVASGVLGENIPSLEGLTKAQLLEVAANLDIEVSKSAKNADIIEAIQTAYPAAETEEA